MTKMTILLLDSFKSNHVGVTKYVRPKMDLTHRPHTTMIKIEDSNYRIMGSSHVGRVLQTKNVHVITFRNTKSVKTKPLR